MSFPSADESVKSAFKLVKAPIYSHCFSQDRSLLAITCDTDCLVYRFQNGHPHLVAKLTDHDKTITAVDISVHGRIVTCSQDRNAYVWEPLSDGSYKPTLVLLRINRAATTVTWAPSGYKFAVGSSARIIAVCYYEQENNWWVSKHIKKPIKSSISCLSWHSNGVLLASGGTDGYMRVFSGFIKGLDLKEVVENSPWGSKFPFGALVKEWYKGCYIHGVEWRSTIENIAYVSHDGTLTVVNSQGDIKEANAPEGLPFRALAWVNDHEIVCAGYSCHPVMFTEGSNKWQFSKNLDKVGKQATPQSTHVSDDMNEDEENPGFGLSALKKFKQLDLKGKISAAEQESAHENAIVELKPFQESNGQVTQVSSCGLDGKIVIYAV